MNMKMFVFVLFTLSVNCAFSQSQRQSQRLVKRFLDKYGKYQPQDQKTELDKPEAVSPSLPNEISRESIVVTVKTSDQSEIDIFGTLVTHENDI